MFFGHEITAFLRIDSLTIFFVIIYRYYDIIIFMMSHKLMYV